MTEPSFLRSARALLVVSALASTAIAQTTLEDAKLLASDGSASDTFGRAVSIDGAFAVVGSPLDKHNNVSSGSAYVFQRGASGWSQVAKLVPSDATNGDVFGTSVGISGDYVVVGAEGDDDAGASSGSAYVFRRLSNGQWAQEAKLTASDAAIYDEFGAAVAIDGNRALVGAKGEDDGGSGAGAAYLFERQTNGTWVQRAKLVSSGPSVGDQFGRSVAIDGDRLVVGAHVVDDGAVDSGAAYVFRRQSNGQWTQEAKLVAWQAAQFDHAGFSVDIDGTRVAVGAYRFDNGGTDTGAVFVFERQSAGHWSQKGTLLASDRASNDRMGQAVQIVGDRVLAGAHGNAHAGFESGAAYLFERNASGSWSQASKLVASDAAPVDQFGRYLAMDGERAMIGSFLDDDKGNGSGSAYSIELGSLTANSPTASITGNGVQDLTLRAGSGFGGAIYAFLGSATGTSGVPLGQGVVLPLTVDAYTQAGFTTGLPIVNWIGTLDGNGRANATYRVPPGTTTAFVGAQFFHAFVAVDPASGAFMASNAVGVTLVP